MKISKVSAQLRKRANRQQGSGKQSSDASATQIFVKHQTIIPANLRQTPKSKTQAPYKPNPFPAKKPKKEGYAKMLKSKIKGNFCFIFAHPKVYRARDLCPFSDFS